MSAGLFDGMDVTDAVCRWCASGLEELPSGSWVDVFGTQSCTAPGPGMHWPVVLV